MSSGFSKMEIKPPFLDDDARDRSHTDDVDVGSFRRKNTADLEDREVWRYNRPYKVILLAQGAYCFVKMVSIDGRSSSSMSKSDDVES
jgi:hypothetical protein